MLAKMPPSLPVSAGVKRSLPEPLLSVELPQVNSGPVVLVLPLAVRHALLPPPTGAVGRDTDPAGPSTVLSWNGWLNRTVPAASALGADAAIPAVIMLSTSVTDTAHGIIRRTSRETIITRLLFRVARSVLRGGPAWRRRGRRDQAPTWPTGPACQAERAPLTGH